MSIKGFSRNSQDQVGSIKTTWSYFYIPTKKSLIDKALDFYMLSLMSLSLAILTKKAIKASLKQEWQKATNLNSEILKTYPKNLDAKIRLGRCYIQARDFNKAKKIFKEVLEVDPINSLALKNLELAKNQKVECSNNGNLRTKSLIKEPGTTYEVKVDIKTKGVEKEDFVSGEELTFKIKKKSIDLYKNKNGKKVVVGSIEDSYVTQRIKCAFDKKAKVLITFIRWKGNEIIVLVKTSISVFKPDKIEIRPYLRKGAIEEPEIEIEIEEEGTE